MKPAGTGDADIGAVVTAGVMIRLEHFTTQRNLLIVYWTRVAYLPARRTQADSEFARIHSTRNAWKVCWKRYQSYEGEREGEGTKSQNENQKSKRGLLQARSLLQHSHPC